MKLSLVLIVYRSDSSIAKEASKFCEEVLKAKNINLMAFSSYIDNNLIQGQVFAIFVITVAAAEAAVGLAILLSLYRNRVTVDMESFNLLKW